MRRLVLLVCLATVLAGGSACAHLASDSYLRIELGDDGRLSGQWDIALRDLDAAIGLHAGPDGRVTWGMLKSRRDAIEAYAMSRLSIAGCAPRPDELLVDYHAGIAYAVLRFDAACTAAFGAISLKYSLLFDLDPSHRGLLTLVTPSGEQSDVLSPEHSEVNIARTPGTVTGEIARFIGFGIDHILIGYDHLLFVAVLMIVAPFRRAGGIGWLPLDRFGTVLVEILKILTAFTIAHTITLSLAVLGVIDIPSRLVDPAVAVTIMLAAIDNVRPILPNIRWNVAFAFGLVHGLAFATALGPMRLPPLGLMLALGGFNLGVEFGQLALALLLISIVFVLHRDRIYLRLLVPALSATAFLLASFWFSQRLGALS
jgi:HupE/UreJ protein